MTTFKEQLAAGDTLNFFALARFMHPIAVEMYSLRGGFDGFGSTWNTAKRQRINCELCS
jgi:hypothetical protein